LKKKKQSHHVQFFFFHKTKLNQLPAQLKEEDNCFCTRIIVFFFQLDTANFRVVVEEEGMFFLASSSLNSLVTGRTTTEKIHLLLFF